MANKSTSPKVATAAIPARDLCKAFGRAINKQQSYEVNSSTTFLGIIMDMAAKPLSETRKRYAPPGVHQELLMMRRD